jgi:hypothetical protein
MDDNMKIELTDQQVDRIEAEFVILTEKLGDYHDCVDAYKDAYAAAVVEGRLRKWPIPPKPDESFEDAMKAAEKSYMVARGLYRITILDTMDDFFADASRRYEKAVNELVAAWSDLIGLDKFYTDSGTDSRLPPDFQRKTKVMPLDRFSRIKLDGTALRKFPCDITELMDPLAVYLFENDSPPRQCDWEQQVLKDD